MKYIQILAGTFTFVASAVLLIQMRTQERLWAFVVLFLLCGANLLSRFTEMSVNDQIADAEEKVAKRVLRRLAKVMPGLLDEYFKAQATKLDEEEKLSDVVFAPLNDPGAKYREANKCSVERDTAGNTVVTARPGCTAADVNAAVGAQIATVVKTAPCSCFLREADPECAEHGMHALCR